MLSERHGQERVRWGGGGGVPWFISEKNYFGWTSAAYLAPLSHFPSGV